MKIEKDKFRVIVRPNSSKNEILGFDEEKKAYHVSIKAVPDKGKANRELIKFLSKRLKKKVRILSGLKNKIKLISSS